MSDGTNAEFKCPCCGTEYKVRYRFFKTPLEAGEGHLIITATFGFHHTPSTNWEGTKEEGFEEDV